MTSRAERREEIRLKLEYVKLALSIVGIGTLIFAALQWMDANHVAKQAAQTTRETDYQRITNEWRDHLRTFVEKPQLRPYFEEMKQLNVDDPNRESVLALADIRLDVMDAILTYVAIREQSGEIAGWRNTFANAFKTSSVLCSRLKEVPTNFANAQIIPIWGESCKF
jgi:hypothetical protein